MPTRANLPPWQEWLLLYLGAVALGSFVLFSEGLFPQTWFSGWAWWHRLALILFVGPFVVVGGIAGYALCEGIVEAAIHATTYALKEHTLPTLIGLVALVSLILAGVGLLLAEGNRDREGRAHRMRLSAVPRACRYMRVPWRVRV